MCSTLYLSNAALHVVVELLGQAGAGAATADTSAGAGVVQLLQRAKGQRDVVVVEEEAVPGVHVGAQQRHRVLIVALLEDELRWS